MGASMKAGAILLLMMFTASGRTLSGRSLELSLSYGFWSSFPFTTLLESQCKKMIDYELGKLLGSVSPLLTLRSDKQSLDFSSAGYAIHSELGYHPPASRFSLSLEASWLHLDLPYDLEYRQSIELLGLPIVQAHTVASGMARIRSLDASVWLHWRIWKVKQTTGSLAAGLHVMPLKGDVSLQGDTSLESIAGDMELDLEDRQTMAELRGEGLHIPRTVVFPALAFSTRTRISRNFGMLARLSLSQGVFLSLGLMVGL
jgi:hypothetical protein